MHELALHLLRALPVAAGDSSDGFKTAIVTTIGVVIAAGLTAFATTFQKDKAAPTPAPLPVPVGTDDLVSAYVHSLEQDRADLTQQLKTVQRKYDKLRDACWEKGQDPDEMIRGQ